MKNLKILDVRNFFAMNIKKTEGFKYVNMEKKWWKN